MTPEKNYILFTLLIGVIDLVIVYFFYKHTKEVQRLAKIREELNKGVIENRKTGDFEEEADFLDARTDVENQMYKPVEKQLKWLIIGAILTLIFFYRSYQIHLTQPSVFGG